MCPFSFLLWPNINLVFKKRLKGSKCVLSNRILVQHKLRLEPHIGDRVSWADPVKSVNVSQWIYELNAPKSGWLTLEECTSINHSLLQINFNRHTQ